MVSVHDCNVLPVGQFVNENADEVSQGSALVSDLTIDVRESRGDIPLLSI